MAYSTSNPPALTQQAIAGARRWRYTSDDSLATVDSAGYFSNGWDLGMRVGDIIEIYDTATPATKLAVVNAGSATVAIDITDGLVITATDTD